MGVGAEPIISDEVAFHALAGDENTTACSKILFGKLKNTISWYPKCLENQFKGVPTWLTDCIPSSLSEIFKEVALQTAPGTSIEGLASCLLRWELVKSRKDIDERFAARSIVFAILG